jgi:hypothetical protein
MILFLKYEELLFSKAINFINNYIIFAQYLDYTC